MTESSRLEATLASANPTASVGHPAMAGRRPLAARAPVSLATQVLLVVASLWLFVIALQLIKAGANGLRPVLDSLSADGVLGHMGFGWLGSYVVMSGSPVAAVAMSLFAGGAITDVEAFAMINGSRMGASLIVLVVGLISYITGRRNPDGLYIGVVALLTAMTLWGPAMPLGIFVLRHGWFDGVNVSGPGALTSLVSYISDPVVDPLKDALPRLLLFLCGVGILACAFTVFDRALPSLDRPGPRIEALSRLLQQRYSMFLFGTLVTVVTMSVSLSVTILVPLALKGYVHRDRVIPYVMGANIATWIDTLFAALLLDSPRAFTVVFTEMLVGGTVSLLVLFFFYRPYTTLILGVAHVASSSRRNLMLLVGCLFVAPVVLLLA